MRHIDWTSRQRLTRTFFFFCQLAQRRKELVWDFTAVDDLKGKKSSFGFWLSLTTGLSSFWSALVLWGLLCFFFFLLFNLSAQTKKKKSHFDRNTWYGHDCTSVLTVEKKSAKKKRSFFFFPPCYCALTLDYISNIHLSFHTPQL